MEVIVGIMLVSIYPVMCKLGDNEWASAKEIRKYNYLMPLVFFGSFIFSGETFKVIQLLNGFLIGNSLMMLWMERNRWDLHLLYLFDEVLALVLVHIKFYMYPVFIAIMYTSDGIFKNKNRELIKEWIILIAASIYTISHIEEFYGSIYFLYFIFYLSIMDFITVIRRSERNKIHC